MNLVPPGILFKSIFTPEIKVVFGISDIFLKVFKGCLKAFETHLLSGGEVFYQVLFSRKASSLGRSITFFFCIFVGITRFFFEVLVARRFHFVGSQLWTTRDCNPG